MLCVYFSKEKKTSCTANNIRSNLYRFLEAIVDQQKGVALMILLPAFPKRFHCDKSIMIGSGAGADGEQSKNN